MSGIKYGWWLRICEQDCNQILREIVICIDIIYSVVHEQNENPPSHNYQNHNLSRLQFIKKKKTSWKLRTKCRSIIITNMFVPYLPSKLDKLSEFELTKDGTLPE